MSTGLSSIIAFGSLLYILLGAVATINTLMDISNEQALKIWHILTLLIFLPLFILYIIVFIFIWITEVGAHIKLWEWK